MAESILNRDRKHWAHARLESMTLDSYIDCPVINGVNFPNNSYITLETAFNSGDVGYLHTDGNTITVTSGSGGGGDLTGEVTSIAGVSTITPNVVTNSKLAQMPAETIKGNVSGSPGNTQDLSKAQVSTFLNLGLISALNSVDLGHDVIGTLLPEQEPAHIGDVTNPAGSLTMTIAADAVTNAKSAPIPSMTIKGNNTAVSANPQDLTTVQVKSMLAISPSDISGLGTLSSLNTIDLSASHVTGVLPNSKFGNLTGAVTSVGYTTTIPNASITNAKLANMPAMTIKGNNTAPGPPSDLTVNDVKVMMGLGDLSTMDSVDLSTVDVTGVLPDTKFGTLIGDVTSSGYATTIAANVVTNAKAAQMAASTIKGNNTGVTANALDLTAVQAREMILNSITTTNGAMIYRGAANWGGVNPGTNGQLLTMVSGTPQWSTGSIPFSNLLSAVNGNAIDNTNYSQQWNWSTATVATPLTMTGMALTTAPLLQLSTAADATAINTTGRITMNVAATTNTTPISVTGVINDFMETKVKNTSNAANAQSGFTAETNNGTATSGFAWMGINGSGFNNPQTYNAGVAGDVTYVGSGEDMIIANASNTKAIKFQTGKATAPFFDDRMAILNNGRIGVGTIDPKVTLDIVGGLGLNSRVDANAAVTVGVNDHTIILTSATSQTVTLISQANSLRSTITLVNRAPIPKVVSPGYITMTGGASTVIPAYSSITLHCATTFYQQIDRSAAAPSAFRSSLATAVSIPQNVNTVIPYNVVAYDTYGDNPTGSSFVCRTAGIHTFSAAVQLNGNASGSCFIELINSNGSAFYAPLMQSVTGVSGATITTDASMAVGETMRCRVRHGSLAAISTTANANYNWFTGRFINY